ncbi:MAG: NAD(P)-binding domain-containing protein [Phormidesmis sp.]
MGRLDPYLCFLYDLGLERFTILERHQISASFSRWPEKMGFITLSFPSHSFGLLDLNAATLKTLSAIAFRGKQTWESKKEKAKGFGSQ